MLENCPQGDLFDFSSTPDDIMKVIHYRLEHPFSEEQRHKLSGYAISRYAFHHFKHATKEVDQGFIDSDMTLDEHVHTNIK